MIRYAKDNKTRDEIIKRLTALQLNLSLYNKPKYGDNFLYTLIETISIQNDEIMKLQRALRDLTQSVHHLQQSSRL